MKVLIILIMTISAVRADEPKYHPYSSCIDGESLASFPSHAFVRKGGDWVPGLPLKISIDDVVLKAREVIAKTRPRHNWQFTGVQLATYGAPNSRQWIVVVDFCATGNEQTDNVRVVCNLSGDVWPIGKVFDPFENQENEENGAGKSD